MCQDYKWLVTIASISGLIQSVLWMGFGIVSALVYLCVIPVAPYKGDSDFFRVTFAKLYFEGPKCPINGSYLGKFNEDYRTVIDLFTPDSVFSVMTTYVTLNAVYFILSILLYMSRKEQEKRKITLGWSGLTIAMCVVDAILTARMILDILSLESYMTGSEKLDVYTSSAKGLLHEIPYIPLVLALLSSRFVFCWLWNFFAGIILFLDALCCRKITGKPSKSEKNVFDNKRQEIVKELRQRTEDREKSASLRNGKYYSAFEVRDNPDYINFRNSMEAVTRFNRTSENSISNIRDANEEYLCHFKSHSSKDWEMTNEGFVNDERNSFESERPLDSERNLKIVKPPLGKPVEPMKE